MIHTAQGDIKVVHATPAQLARIQEAHNIQVINDDQLLPAVLQESSGMLTSDGTGELVDGDTLSLGEHQTLTLVTSTGEVLSLSAAGGLSLGDEGTNSLGDDDSKLLVGCTD
ncbi:hypothetical protein B566_EDAN003583 [Ephemera danica]|nr:hypothetical protein B566_EDAN003583 [Ephemera danica]